MQFRDNDYYQAGLERMRLATIVHKQGGSYALSMYCSGLAVECLLRAFRWQEDASFEGRHDLRELLKASRLMQRNEAHVRRRKKSEDKIVDHERALKAALNDVMVLWHNNLRFASEARLEAYLRGIGRAQQVKGDVLKKNSADLLEAAQTIMDRGVTLWTSEAR